jgi:3-oxoacyl-[acyl-carrier protein] reductase
MDILINNAGKTEDNLFMRMTDKQWEDVMLINLTSVMRLTRGVIRGMIKKRWGRIINISSIVALTGNSGQSNYVAAKSGLIGFSKSLASEIASRGITVNCIAPGFIETNMTEKLNENQKNLILSKIPMNRIGLPIEICSSAIFLASSFSNYITGQTIHVNGGMYMS